MITLAALALSLLTQDNDWKKSWVDALKEAKDSKKLALLFFHNDGVKASKAFNAETLTKTEIKIALQRYVCCRIDPEGSDDDNKLWQKHKMPTPPIMFVYEPDGTLLATIGHTKAEYVQGVLESIPKAYFDKIVPARDTLSRTPDDVDALTTMGEAYALMDDLNKSNDAYKKAIDAAQKKSDTAGTIKVIRSQFEAYNNKQREWNVALRPSAKKLLEIDPNDGSKLGAKAAYLDGYGACMERRFQEAISILKPACEKYKNSDMLCDLMMWLGSAYVNAKDNDNAVKVFDQVVEKFPNTKAANDAKALADKLRK